MQQQVPPPTEFKMHTALVELLLQATMPNWLWTHIGHGEKRDEVTAARLKRMGVQRGWPDFIFVGPGRVFFLELKRIGGKPTPEQREVAVHLMACGCGYLVTNDLDDAVGTLRDLGIVRATVSA